MERVPRLGDVVDDYCPRCRLMLNHDVASLFGDQVAKVTCRTCHNTHDYRHGQAPPKRQPKVSEKRKLMDQVLAGLGRTPEPSAEDGVPEPAVARLEPTPTVTAPLPEAVAAAPDAGPTVKKRRDLWAEYERIKSQAPKG